MSFLAAIIKPLAYISVPVILVRQVAVSSTVGRYYARVVFYVGTLVTVASCGFFIGLGMTCIGRSTDTGHYAAYIFYALISRALDLHIKVEGEEHLNTKPVVLMVNHQSMLDILVIGRLLPKRAAVMSKKSLQFSPLGPFMMLAGTIFIDRGDSASAVRSINAAGEKMKTERTSLWIFPEGTRHLSPKPDMLPLKKGGFHFALNAGIPIIPIVVENYWHIYHKGIFGSGTFTVRVLPPISTKEYTVTDVGLLSTRVRAEMMTALRDISSHAIQNVAATPAASPKPTPQSEPLAFTAPLLTPLIPGDSLDSMLDAKTESTNSSRASSSERRKLSSSDAGTGTETEEDEGMILVGRPS